MLIRISQMFFDSFFMVLFQVKKSIKAAKE